MNSEQEYPEFVPCPKCGHSCGPDDIHGCDTLRCPSCGNIFEPIDEGRKLARVCGWCHKEITPSHPAEFFIEHFYHTYCLPKMKKALKAAGWNLRKLRKGEEGYGWQ